MSTTVAEERALDSKSIDTLFRQARTLRKWQPRKVEPALLQELYNLLKLGPTASNLSPARFVFLTTEESKTRLLPHMWEGNREQTRTAPVVALVAYDLEFYQKADKLTPKGNPEQVKARLQNNPLMAEHLAKQSGTLQGAYLIMAARALGLDAGPMGGFDADKINQEFFAGTSLRINFVCNLGYGERDSLHSRLARLDFEEAVTVL